MNLEDRHAEGNKTTERRRKRWCCMVKEEAVKLK